MVVLTVNVLPPDYGDPAELSGHQVCIGETRYVVEELNEWHYLHLTSPTGMPLVSCFDVDETTHWVDDTWAVADVLSRQPRHSRSTRYRLRGKTPWLHHEPGGQTICAWLDDEAGAVESGVRASRLVDEYLDDGADEDTIAMMVALTTGVNVVFVSAEAS